MHLGGSQKSNDKNQTTKQKQSKQKQKQQNNGILYTEKN